LNPLPNLYLNLTLIVLKPGRQTAREKDGRGPATDLSPIRLRRLAAKAAPLLGLWSGQVCLNRRAGTRILTTPFGIWSLVVLNRPDARGAFDRAGRRGQVAISLISRCLDSIKLSVRAAPRHELFMCANFCNAGAGEHDDKVRHPYRREPVRYQDSNTPAILGAMRRITFVASACSSRVAFEQPVFGFGI